MLFISGECMYSLHQESRTDLIAVRVYKHLAGIVCVHPEKCSDNLSILMKPFYFDEWSLLA